MINGYSEGELALAVRQEKATLICEKAAISRRLRQLEERLDELAKAEALLEGGFP